MLGALGIYLGIFTPSGFNCQYCPGSFGLFDFENKFEGDTSPRIEKSISDRLCKTATRIVGSSLYCLRTRRFSQANINIKPCMYNDFK